MLPLSDQRKHSGFTLVELSIVLVIIGLIVGGVLVGRDLIKAAETQKKIRQITEFDTAVVGFRSKYKGIPGDTTRAQQFFPDTTNGNDNAKIEWITGESVQAWLQLARAGLIAGDFSGTGATLTAANAPTASDKGAYALFFAEFGIAASASASFNNSPGNYIELMGIGSSPTTVANRGTLSRLEAFTIDTKLDDGNMLTGRVYGGLGLISGCAVNSGGYRYLSSYYNSTQETIGSCNIGYRLSVQN